MKKKQGRRGCGFSRAGSGCRELYSVYTCDKDRGGIQLRRGLSTAQHQDPFWNPRSVPTLFTSLLVQAADTQLTSSPSRSAPSHITPRGPLSPGSLSQSSHHPAASSSSFLAAKKQRDRGLLYKCVHNGKTGRSLTNRTFMEIPEIPGSWFLIYRTWSFTSELELRPFFSPHPPPFHEGQQVLPSTEGLVPKTKKAE